MEPSLRSSVANANNAYGTASNTAAGLGGAAGGISGNLTPFLTSELENPQGYSPQDESAMLASGEAAAGGANSGLVGQANEQAATSRNAGGFQAALDDAARQRTKAAAATSEGIASNNAGLKVQEQQDAAKGLQGLYGTDTSGMLDAMGQESKDTDAATEAGKSGWLQNALGILGTLNQGAKGIRG